MERTELLEGMKKEIGEMIEEYRKLNDEESNIDTIRQNQGSVIALKRLINKIEQNEDLNEPD